MCISKLCSILFVIFICEDKIQVCSVPQFRTRNGEILKAYSQFAVRYGQPLELFCSDDNSQKLEILRNGVFIPTEIINDTTIRLFIEKPDKEVTDYVCIYNSSLERIFHVTVYIDSAPEVENFKCKSKNLEYLNCSWTSKTLKPTFKIFEIENGNLKHRCTVDKRPSKFCVWDTQRSQVFDFLEQEKNGVSLLMTVCNAIQCVNETFSINQLSVLKADPPRIKVLKRFAYSAVLQITISNDLYLYSEKGLDYKIDYWFYGIQPRKFDYIGKLIEQRETKEIDVLLPCPDMFYAVRVAIRPKEAIDEEFWSDYAIVTFFTKPDIMYPNTDPTCKKEMKENSAVMIYKLKVLREEVNEKQLELIEKIRLLKARVVSIKKLKSILQLRNNLKTSQN